MTTNMSGSMIFSSAPQAKMLYGTPMTYEVGHESGPGIPRTKLASVEANSPEEAIDKVGSMKQYRTLYNATAQSWFGLKMFAEKTKTNDV